MNHIYHDLFIGASANEVYNAVTSPEHLTRWWPLKCSGAPVLGAAYNFFFTPEYDWYGKVTKCVKNRSFHVKMTQADADWNPTTFGFDLMPVEGGINLQFWHKDWPEVNHHFRRSSYCWAILLKGLKEYVENGIVVPFEERE